MSALAIGRGWQQGVVMRVNRRRYIAIAFVADKGYVVFGWTGGFGLRLNDLIEGYLDRRGETQLHSHDSGDEFWGHVHLVRCSWSDAQGYTR